MKPYARSALYAAPEVRAQLAAAGDAPQARLEAVAGTDELGGRLSALLLDRIRAGHILGAQLVVLHKGRRVVDLCAGVDSPYALR